MLVMPQTKCIYCGTEDPLVFTTSEHVISQSFGTYGSDTPTLIDAVCKDCNHFFKDIERVLARDTLEGVARYKHGISSSEDRPQKDMEFAIAESEEAGDFGGVLLEGVATGTGLLRKPAAQFHVLNKKTGEYDKFKLDQIEELKLPEDTYGVGAERKCRVFGPSKEDHDKVVEALRRAGIPYSLKEHIHPMFLDGLKEGETATIEVAVSGTIDDERKRALVKNLINYATKFIGHEEVLKTEWLHARRYARYGEGKILGRMTTKPFWDGQETDTMRFPDDSINVRIENQKQGVVGVIQFYNLFTYEFVLCEGYYIPEDSEVAHRFTRGKPPSGGFKMSKPDWVV